MNDVFLIRDPDDIVFYLQSSATTQDIRGGDERVARIVELSRLAYMAKEQGKLKTALQYESEAYRLCLQLSDASGGTSFPSLVAAKTYNMGQLHYLMGEIEKAKSCFEQARELDAEAENLVGQAASIRSLGFLQQDTGNLQTALELHKEALRLDHKAAFEHGVAIDQANIGAIYFELHDFRQAMQYFGQALTSPETWGQAQEAERLRQLMQAAESQLA